MKKPQRRSDGVSIPLGIGGWEAINARKARSLWEEIHDFEQATFIRRQDDLERLADIERRIRSICDTAVVAAREDSAAALKLARELDAVVADILARGIPH